MTEPTLPAWAKVNPRCPTCGLVTLHGVCAMEPHDEEGDE